ncbi:hypothetical protein HMPREF3291_04565 [Bacillus sp. HMSC76G11]|nr:hypothetical protein HMPREF3291_04565 [Bacillus sp. HMSC76G11]
MRYIYCLSIYFLFVLIFINEWIQIQEDVFVFLSSVTLISLLISSIFMTRGFQFYVSVISLVFGHAILYYYGFGFKTWYGNLASGISIPVLFLAIPMISFPLKYGNYFQSIEGYIKSKKAKPISIFLFLSILHLALTIPLNIGSIPAQQKLIEKINFPKDFLVRVYTAGYSSYMVFSPFDPVVNMVLIWTAISYTDYFFSALIMVIFIFTVTSIILRIDKKLRNNFANSLPDCEGSNEMRNISHLLIHLSFMIILAVFCAEILPLSNQIYVIAVIVILYSFVWCFFIGAARKMIGELKSYNKSLLQFKTLIPFLLSSSFFANCVSNTPLKEEMGKAAIYFHDIPVYFIIFLILLMTSLLSLCGIHMMITIPLFAMTIVPADIGLSSIGFAITLLTGWYVSMSISPLVPFGVAVAESIGITPVQVTLRYNLIYYLIVLFFAPLVITIINYATIQ